MFYSLSEYFPHGSGGEISLVSYANKKSTIRPKYIFSNVGKI